MKTIIVKLDTTTAKIYDWPATAGVPKILEEHHTVGHNNFNNDGHKLPLNKFFHLVAHEIDSADEIYILGNHVTNAEFKHHLENHHHSLVLKKLVGVDNINGHATDAEVLAKAKEFFTHYRTFSKNY